MASRAERIVSARSFDVTGVITMTSPLVETSTDVVASMPIASRTVLAFSRP